MVHRSSGTVSLDLSLAADTENFDLQRGGLQKGRCFICEWDRSARRHTPTEETGYAWSVTTNSYKAQTISAPRIQKSLEAPRNFLPFPRLSVILTARHFTGDRKLLRE